MREGSAVAQTIPSHTYSAIRSSEVDGPSLRFVISPRLNRRAHSRLVHGRGHIVRALGARAGRVDLSGRLIVGGCLLMHDGRAYRVRRKAGRGSGTGRDAGPGTSHRPRASAYRAGHRELAHSADADRRAHWPAKSCVSVEPAGPYRDVGGLHGPVNDTGQVISHRSLAGRVVGCGEEPGGNQR